MRFTKLDLVQQADGTYKLKPKAKTKSPPRHLEHKAQVEVFKWADTNMQRYPDLKWLNPSLTGMYMQNPLQAYRAKAAGLKKGYPDLFLPVRKGKYIGLFIELKIKGNHPTVEQKEWLEHLKTQGNRTCVGYGSEETIKMLEEYLSL